jgi:hypothetical protein
MTSIELFTSLNIASWEVQFPHGRRPIDHVSEVSHLTLKIAAVPYFIDQIAWMKDLYPTSTAQSSQSHYALQSLFKHF